MAVYLDSLSFWHLFQSCFLVADLSAELYRCVWNSEDVSIKKKEVRRFVLMRFRVNDCPQSIICVATLAWVQTSSYACAQQRPFLGVHFEILSIFVMDICVNEQNSTLSEIQTLKLCLRFLKKLSFQDVFSTTWKNLRHLIKRKHVKNVCFDMSFLTRLWSHPYREPNAQATKIKAYRSDMFDNSPTLLNEGSIDLWCKSLCNLETTDRTSLQISDFWPSRITKT